MSFDDLARKFCKDNPNDERCACFESNFPSVLDVRKGKAWSEEIKRCYNPVCLGSDYVPSNLTSAHTKLKKCIEIYNLQNKTIKNVYGICNEKDDSGISYFKSVGNWDYNCDQNQAICEGGEVCDNSRKSEAETEEKKEKCKTEKEGLAWWIILLIVIGSILVAIGLSWLIYRINRNIKKHRCDDIYEKTEKELIRINGGNPLTENILTGDNNTIIGAQDRCKEKYGGNLPETFAVWYGKKHPEIYNRSSSPTQPLLASSSDEDAPPSQPPPPVPIGGAPPSRLLPQSLIEERGGVPVMLAPNLPPPPPKEDDYEPLDPFGRA